MFEPRAEAVVEQSRRAADWNWSAARLEGERWVSAADGVEAIGYRRERCTGNCDAARRKVD